MKLFLASSLDKTLSLLLPRLSKPPKETRVLFVANAADPFEDKWWVDLDRQAFIKEGFQLKELDLKETAREAFIEHLDNSDILHICGGSVFYLLALIIRKGIKEDIINFVQTNKIIYTGTSAGSILAALSVHLYLYDEEEFRFTPLVKDFAGLGFVDFLIFPHSGNPKFIESNKKMIEHLPEYSIPVFLLYDEQAIWVEDGKFELVSV